jgi:hypothetical protein
MVYAFLSVFMRGHENEFIVNYDVYSAKFKGEPARL